MSRILYLDCFSGASGDMIVGALIDAGVSFSEVEAVVKSLDLDGVRVSCDRVDRSGIGAAKFRVIDAVAIGNDLTGSDVSHDHVHNHDHDHSHDHSHSHDHDHSHHQHRGLSEITEIVKRSELSSESQLRAVSLFRRLAEIEAGIHQMPIEEVHLHEVGAVDSIVDIVGAVRAFELLDVDQVIASPMNVGSGTVRCAHGELPVPAPATAKLLVDAPIYSKGPAVELVTPTGALLVTEYADGYGVVPPMRITEIGYGAGDRDFKGRPNVVRAFVGETTGVSEADRVVVLECQIDDMNPQIYGVLMERLTAAGALDVFYAPIQMKKNRPATSVTVIARPRDREALTTLLFIESTTIGVRVSEMDRSTLDREIVSIDSPFGMVRVKVARRNGTVLNVAPEFDDCARVAQEHGRSVKEIQAVVMKSWLDSESSS